jgi:DNA-binding NarL/FixJ family response regulator
MSRTALIVDDHAAFRASARRLLESVGYDVVGEAADGMSAVAAAANLRPSVVLLDVQLPDLDGFEVARRIAARSHAPTIILTSIRDAADYQSRLGASPARGFIGKLELSEERIADLVGGSR